MSDQAYEEKEIHRLVYFGGVAPSLRKEVWPFLLGHYQFHMTEKCRLEVFLCSVRENSCMVHTAFVDPEDSVPDR